MRESRIELRGGRFLIDWGDYSLAIKAIMAISFIFSVLVRIPDKPE